ncbi:MAG: 4Fe-4S dicluster domain-containing protein [Clostridium butyricum]|nr:4Fe-4S dicluster domain-containing protein [Clostridium butyricum]
MNNYPIVTTKMVGDNKRVKKVQKESKKSYKYKRSRYVKAKLSKLVKETGYLDMVGESKEKNINTIDKKDLLLEIEKAQLTGMSGNGFPTYKKLKAVLESSSENRVVIINGAECDPGLIHDEWLIRNRLDDIILGSKLISDMIGANDVFLATRLKKGFESIEGIKVKPLPNRYPMGAENILIKQTLGIELDKNVIPVSVGILVINVQTVIRIAEIYKGVYLKNSRYITVADYVEGEAKVVRVGYDSNAQDILEKVFGKQNNKVKYLGGGVMNAHEMNKEDKIGPKVNFIGYGEQTNYDQASKCKKCRRCSKNCPMGIKVHKIISAYEKKQEIDAKIYGTENCINCGTCTFVCAAGKNTMKIVNKV